MKTIGEIYRDYDIMPNLALHQVRVAAVCAQISENLSLPTDIKSLVAAALIHDIANIIKFDLSYFPEFTEALGVMHWEGIKKKFIEKYGDDEHVATVLVAHELGVSQRVIELVDGVRFKKICEHKEGEDIEMKVLHYADCRVGPHGIVSLMERFRDGGERYKNHKNKVSGKEREANVSCAFLLEEEIMQNLPESKRIITDESIKPRILALESFTL